MEASRKARTPSGAEDRSGLGNMRKAIVDGNEMSIDDYRLLSHEQRRRAGSPTCRECLADVHPYGLVSIDAAPRFDHPDASQGAHPLDDCSLARRSARLRWFGGDEMDHARGARVRNRFFEDDSLVGAYAFCLSCAGRGNLPLAKFGTMVARADSLDIWSYVGVETWCVPHVLLLLEDFGSRTGTNCHFALWRAQRLGSIWSGPRPVGMIKLFTDSLHPYAKLGDGPNPRPILKDDVSRVATDWVPDGVVRALRAFR